MTDIFLSASIPLPTRDRRFFESANVLAIRESLKALVEVILPTGSITFGGHPAITPLISFFVSETGLERDRLTVFQSRYFERALPPENTHFHHVRMIDAVQNDEQESLAAMRTEMISSRRFRAAVIIGGMEGVFDEVDRFRTIHPNAEVLPVASTGAAAAEIYNGGRFPSKLLTELTYTSLFRRHFI
jgi:hypothetical protein